MSGSMRRAPFLEAGLLVEAGRLTGASGQTPTLRGASPMVERDEVSVTAETGDRALQLAPAGRCAVRLLRIVVLRRPVVPLVLTALVALAAGLAASELYLHAQLFLGPRPVELAHYVMGVVGAVASLRLVRSSIWLIARITGAAVGNG